MWHTLSTVIPGRAESAIPESITTNGAGWADPGYGFRHSRNALGRNDSQRGLA
jgi:hypothetical protein